jgi:hypothetical protein
VLTGVTHVPVIRKDGSISVEPGYDAVTGLYLDPRGTRFPKVEEFPTKQEARLGNADDCQSAKLESRSNARLHIAGYGFR